MKKNWILSLTLSMAILTACTNPVDKKLFGKLGKKDVYLLTFTNKKGNIIKLTNFGARITWIEVPDKNGKKDNITFGYETFEGTIKGDKSFGTVIGRYAGGIGGKKFVIDGVQFKLPPYSDPLKWRNVVWNMEVLNNKFPTVRFTYISPDMEEGFPGTMNVEVIYTWTDNNEIIIDYTCSTDKKTVLNITNHAYFNLHGAGEGDILDHELVIKAATFTPIDSDMVSTGEIRPVAGTPFDFTTPQIIGERIDEEYEQLDFGNGYDHNFVLDNKEEVDATVYEPESGRMLEVITDQPGILLYTGNFLNGSEKGYNGAPYNFRTALCLETGHFPDSPIFPDFPSTLINPGVTFRSTTIYRFSVK